MKKFSNITILTLSISLASASTLALQAVDPTDYIGYTHGAYRAVDPTDYVGYAQGAYTYIPAANVHQGRRADTAAEFARSGRDADDRESRRIGKLLWKSDYVQVDHSKWSSAKMLEWPLLWQIGHVQDELEWPLLWKIGYVQDGHDNVN